ncbi:MAG: hypothetical protein ACKKL5_00450 [Candidatus Komeilibacteria bacterium]
MIFSDWVLDIMHNQHQAINNDRVNHCSYFCTGEAHYFVELDLAGGGIQV